MLSAGQPRSAAAALPRAPRGGRRGRALRRSSTSSPRARAGSTSSIRWRPSPLLAAARRDRARRWPRLGRPVRGCRCSLSVALTLVAARGQGAGGEPAPGWDRAQGRAGSPPGRATWRRGCAPGDTVQVLDTTAGGIHALLRLGVRQPTRFIYDFHFFHDVERPAHPRAARRARGGPRRAAARRCRGVRAGWPGRRLRAPRRASPSCARLLWRAYRSSPSTGRRLPDLCAARPIQQHHPRLRRSDRARLLLGALLDPAPALPRRDRPVPARAGPRARPRLRLRALLALLRGDARRGAHVDGLRPATRAASRMARAAAARLGLGNVRLRGRRRHGLPGGGEVRRRLHARHRPPRPGGDGAAAARAGAPSLPAGGRLLVKDVDTQPA